MPTQETTSTHEQLMDSAYARWQGTGWSKDQFWAQLNEREQVAVFIGNMNYQVENGGWYQWCDNGYLDCAAELEDILREKIGTATALEVADMVSTVACAWNQFQSDQNDIPGDFFCTCDDEDECDCETEEDVWIGAHATFTGDTEKLNTRFYSINADLLQDVEKYLNGKPLERAEKPTAATATQAPTAPGKIRVKLVGEDSNAFNIIGRVTDALKRGGRRDLVENFQSEATSGDYNKVLQTAMKYVEVY